MMGDLFFVINMEYGWKQGKCIDMGSGKCIGQVLVSEVLVLSYLKFGFSMLLSWEPGLVG